MASPTTSAIGDDAAGSAANQSRPRSRILRFDQIFDLRSGSTKLEKTIKPREKLERKYGKRNPVLVVRRIISQKGRHVQTVIDIRSKFVADALIEINKDVEDLNLNKSPPEADPELFFHSWDGLQEALQRAKVSSEPNQELIDDLKVACDFVKEDHGSTIMNRSSLLAAGEITWSLLWTLMKPNSLVYHYHELTEQHQILRFRSIKMCTPSGAPPYWKLNCDIIADDGTRFGLAREPAALDIEEFQGTRTITDLPVYPLDINPEADKIKEEALERGRLFQKMKDPYFCQTLGFAMTERRNDLFETRRFKIRSYGRAMVDPAAFRTFNPNVTFIPSVSRTLERESLTDEQLLITNPVALGFCFGNKQWLGLPMSRLLPIEWNPLAFKQLVLEQRSKDLIHSLIKHHRSKHDDFDDIVAGKGKGTICLLSGSPGCGKTLTAEAAAEVTQRPLYSVSAGELGTEVYDVDEKLTVILELARTWDAVLLLDEADVFLQKRDSNDIKRNALVSIFLRQIEYYQGILILTTNRIAQFDLAFESRIHVSIRYPELDKAARRDIWGTFLARAGKSAKGMQVSISEGEKEVLAAREINGRQIKNVVNGALALAKEEEKPLNISHIENVLSVMHSWRQYEESDSFPAPKRAGTGASDLLI
ncbi:P-loop containing nucleoside triphosphate hydrolase protein [Hypoxylon crocopeplum]|nr:P-loop containing nucleoside triphosphate hydrolase protein [Hypoxylon crocopeplum]